MKQRKRYDFTQLLQGIADTFHEILRMNVYETKYTRTEIQQRMKEKQQLRNALKQCSFGDHFAKRYVKSYISDILLQKYKITNETIEQIIPFSNQKQLSCEQKFGILLYLWKQQYQADALSKLIMQYQLDRPKEKEDLIYYEITASEIDWVYQKQGKMKLTFLDQLQILTQFLYQAYRGNGVIDEIRDMNIDGISAGVSGIPETMKKTGAVELNGLPCAYDSIWIFYRGKSIHCSFLGFHSEKELIRVCKNIYRYGAQRQLTEVSGYVVNEMMDGSRVSVARPPFCENWVFFIRKFQSIRKAEMSQLLTDQNSDIPIQMIRWLIKGCQVIGITGEQGAGKTTLLMAMIAYIPLVYNLRVQELAFELHLRKLYPNRNIVTFRETNSTSGQEGLDFQKKTDGTVNILGEVASAPVANWLVQMSMVASLFTLFTHHAKTTRDLVIALRNALLMEGGFQNERIATEQVTDAIHFDIHMKKDKNGHRYIERITEIVSLREEQNAMLTGTLFETRELLSFQDGKYVFQLPPSKQALARMQQNWSEKDRVSFETQLEAWKKR